MKNKELLLTGGSGSLGKTLVKHLIAKNEYKGIRIFSRTEDLQYKMQQEFLDCRNITYILGDVANKERVMMAMRGVNIVIHAAAQKHLPSCEANPITAIDTNILGTKNIISCAVCCKVEKVLGISSDKCVKPINLYGMTKGVAEKLLIQGNIYGAGRTKFSCTRYGNVLNSRGSIVQLIDKLKKEGKSIPITDEKMSRFWITLDQVADFILNRIEDMIGGEIFIPLMPVMPIKKMVEALAPESKTHIIGIRKGEKIFEELICKEESFNSRGYRNNKGMIKTFIIIANRLESDLLYSYLSDESPALGKPCLTKDGLLKLLGR